MNAYDLTTCLREAYALGITDGENAASWAVDPNETDEDNARAILTGIEAGDPRVMDMQPSPLSGEYVDDRTPAWVLAEASGIDPDAIDPDDAQRILDAFEEAYAEGFWDVVTRNAQAALGAARMEGALYHAKAALFGAIAEAFPEVSTGDLAPDADAAIDAAMTDALQAWLLANHPAIRRHETWTADTTNALGRVDA